MIIRITTTTTAAAAATTTRRWYSSTVWSSCERQLRSYTNNCQSPRMPHCRVMPSEWFQYISNLFRDSITKRLRSRYHGSKRCNIVTTNRRCKTILINVNNTQKMRHCGVKHCRIETETETNCETWVSFTFTCGWRCSDAVLRSLDGRERRDGGDERGGQEGDCGWFRGRYWAYHCQEVVHGPWSAQTALHCLRARRHPAVLWHQRCTPLFLPLAVIADTKYRKCFMWWCNWNHVTIGHMLRHLNEVLL